MVRAWSVTGYSWLAGTAKGSRVNSSREGNLEVLPPSASFSADSRLIKSQAESGLFHKD